MPDVEGDKVCTVTCHGTLQEFVIFRIGPARSELEVGLALKRGGGQVSKSSIILSTAEGAKRAKICLLFCVLRDLCGEEMRTEFMTIYLAEEFADFRITQRQRVQYVGSSQSPFILVVNILGYHDIKKPRAYLLQYPV